MVSGQDCSRGSSRDSGNLHGWLRSLSKGYGFRNDLIERLLSGGNLKFTFILQEKTFLSFCRLLGKDLVGSLASH